MDIHGQHAHLSLLRASHQRRLLDDYSGHQTQVAAVVQAYCALVETRSEL